MEDGSLGAHFLAADNVVFLVALGLFLVLGVLQVVSFVLGASIFSFVDHHLPDADLDVGAPTSGFEAFLSFLGLGKVPFAISMFLFLFLFSCVGFNLQLVLAATSIGRLSALPASLVALVVTLPLLRWVSSGVARILPKDESLSVSEETFMGKIMDGGALKLPVFHEIMPVNMRTLRLQVDRKNEEGLITADRMRVDVTAEFYVRVRPVTESLAKAAQTLGNRTLEPERLKELLQGKFVDSLRSVAAGMSMEQLHEKRVEFVQSVQQSVSEDLLKNGLELESVSLTALDQTARQYFKEDNAFDAQGLAKLTQITQEKKEVYWRRKRCVRAPSPRNARLGRTKSTPRVVSTRRGSRMNRLSS